MKPLRKKRGNDMEKVCALVLVAGKGSRMMTESDQRAKALRELLNRPMLYHVLEKIDFLKESEIGVVLGYQAKEVKQAVENFYLKRLGGEDGLSFASHFFSSDVTYFLQTEQLGTGHAVRMAEAWLLKKQKENYEHCLVCFGDTPTILKDTYLQLLQTQEKEKASATILSAILPEPEAFGRILRDEKGAFVAIKEAKDCTEEERKIQEINTGLAVFRIADMLPLLEKLSPKNAQEEYYITDIPLLLTEQGKKVCVHCTENVLEGKGVNTLEELNEVEKALLSLPFQENLAKTFEENL